MSDLFSDPPYILLILGFASIFGAVVSTCTGKTPLWHALFVGLVYRAKGPSEFWWVVTIYFLPVAFF